jgi:hypothetical protein
MEIISSISDKPRCDIRLMKVRVQVERFIPDNPLNLIRAITTPLPLLKKMGGYLSVAGTQKFPSAPSQALPLLQRGRLVKFPNRR